MSLVIRILHCYFIVYYIILWIHQLIDWLYLVYSPQLCEIQVLSAKSCTQFMCLIINHFVMYYCNLQVIYMVTVLFRQLLLFRFYICFHVLNVLFACVFSNTDTVSWLVGVQIKVMLQQPLTCDSSFMLPTCFPHSPPHSPTLVLVFILLGCQSTPHF